MLRLIPDDDALVLNDAQIRRIKHLLLEFIPARVCVVNAGPNASIAVPDHGLDELAPGVHAAIEATIGGQVHVVAVGERGDRPHESCGVCGSSIVRTSLVLCEGPEAGVRLCKFVSKCAEHGHIMWRWNDGLASPMQRDDSLAFVFSR